MKGTTRHLPLLLLVLALFIPHLATAQQAAPQGPEPSTIVFTVQQAAGWNGYTQTGKIQLNFLDTLGNNFQVVANYDQNSTPSSIASDLVSQFLQTYPTLSTSSWSGATGATFGLALTLYDNFSSWQSMPSCVSGYEYCAIFNFTTVGPQPPQQPQPTQPPFQLPVVTMNADGTLNITTPDGSQFMPPPTEAQLTAQEMQAVTPVSLTDSWDDPDYPGFDGYTVTYADGSSITVTLDPELDSSPNPPLPPEFDDGGGGGGGGGDPYSNPCGSNA